MNEKKDLINSCLNLSWRKRSEWSKAIPKVSSHKHTGLFKCEYTNINGRIQPNYLLFQFCIVMSVIGICRWHNPTGCSMALGLTHPPVGMGTRNISWVVTAASAQGWHPYHLHVPVVLKFGSFNLLEPSGPVRLVMGCSTFTVKSVLMSYCVFLQFYLCEEC
jgi:hypothetical protein